MGCSLGRLTKGLYFYLSGSVLVKIESQWYSAETQWDLTPGFQVIHAILSGRISDIFCILCQSSIQL